MTDAYKFRTYTGELIDFRDPNPAQIALADIAHHLAYTSRFGGASHQYYSVASHCVYVSRRLEDEGYPPSVQLAGLLHDSAEAYLGDVVSGLKRLLPDYRAIELRWERVLERTFGVEWIGVPEVKNADLRARLAEARDLFDGQYPLEKLDTSGRGLAPYGVPVRSETPDEAEFAYLSRAAELGLLLDADDDGKRFGD